MESRLKKLKITYYAVLREQRGLSCEEVQTLAETPLDLYRELPISLPIALVRPAVNGRFVEMDHLLADGDEVVFIPPVAGG